MRQILYDTVSKTMVIVHWSSKQCPVVQSPQLPPIFKQLTFHSGKMEIYWLVSTPPPPVLVKDQYISVFSFEGFSKKQRKLKADLDFVKEKHPILFMMPKRGDRKVKSDAVEDLRLWSEANDARENVFFN